jgi:hypothetical protein
MNDSSGGAATRRRAILVAGMHRSGTSALTRTFNMLGAELPKELLPGSRGNELGHWEPAKIVELHDEMLRSAGSSWDCVFGVKPDWFTSPAARHYRGSIEDFVQEQFATTALFVIKDPRICLFVPLWVEALSAVNVEPVFALPFRHPLEVASSILRRQSHFEPDGSWPPGRGSLLWLRYVLDAERATRGYPRSFVQFDDLFFQNWQREIARMGAQLGLVWPKQDADTTAEIGRFLNSEHKHEDASTASWEDSRVAPLSREVFADLAACIADPSAGQEEFDRATRELDAGSALFESYVADLEAKKVAILERERVASAHRQVELETDRRVDGARIRELEQHNQALMDANAKLGRDLESREADMRSVLGSTSWRVTKPLRALKTAVSPRGR